MRKGKATHVRQAEGASQIKSIQKNGSKQKQFHFECVDFENCWTYFFTLFLFTFKFFTIPIFLFNFILMILFLFSLFFLIKFLFSLFIYLHLLFLLFHIFCDFSFSFCLTFSFILNQFSFTLLCLYFFFVILFISTAFIVSITSCN